MIEEIEGCDRNRGRGCAADFCKDRTECRSGAGRNRGKDTGTNRDPKKAPLQALIFDSLYDAYKGVIVFCRIKEGTVKKGTPILMMATEELRQK